jgi:hypothetical protein
VPSVLSVPSVASDAPIRRFPVRILSLFASITVCAILFIAIGAPSGADSVGNLRSQAKAVSQQLLLDQLQVGAYQQQYDVASQTVSNDQQAIAGTQQEIATDKRDIANQAAAARRLAVMAYILNGSVVAPSGAALFEENLQTLESANEYATISVGDLNEAIATLHTTQRAVQAQVVLLVQQKAADEAEQSRQATYLGRATATAAHMSAVQAHVTGQLATAVAQQQASEAAQAAAAVAAAQHATAARTVDYVPGNEVDPTLNPYLQCVRQVESGGNYAAVSPNGEYMGAFQFSQPTWNSAAQSAGRSDLVGVPPNVASRADQDTIAVALYALDGDRPWLGDRCSPS